MVEFFPGRWYNAAKMFDPVFHHPMDVVGQLKFGLSFLVIVLVGGTLGYSLIEGWGPLDSLYMTVITITTVGFGEVRPLSHGGIVFTMILILASVGMVAFVVVGLARIMVEGEVRRIFGRRKLEKKIGSLKNHYIICGFGRIGSYICKELAEKPLPFVVVEREPRIAQEVEEKNYYYVTGDATDDETLQKAGIDSATCLVAAGANKAVSPYLMGAQRMAMALLQPAVVDFIEIAMHKRSLELQLEEIKVHSVARLPASTLRDSGIRSELDLIVVGIKKESGKMIYNPSSETRVETGDILITLGERKNLDKLERRVGFQRGPEGLK